MFFIVFVNFQRQLRLQDTRQVEVKAARIKEWVTNKLRELEEQNQHLKEQNNKCNQQLELLREQNNKCNQQLELLRNHIGNISLRPPVSSLIFIFVAVSGNEFPDEKSRRLL